MMYLSESTRNCCPFTSCFRGGRAKEKFHSFKQFWPCLKLYLSFDYSSFNFFMDKFKTMLWRQHSLFISTLQAILTFGLVTFQDIYVNHVIPTVQRFSICWICLQKNGFWPLNSTNLSDTLTEPYIKYVYS